MAKMKADRARDDSALPNENDPKYRRLINTLRRAIQRADYDLDTRDFMALQRIVNAMDALTAYVKQHEDWTRCNAGCRAASHRAAS
jgi:methionyl-tRNA synthetase